MLGFKLNHVNEIRLMAAFRYEDPPSRHGDFHKKDNTAVIISPLYVNMDAL